jgi:hypothetical protein
MFRFKHSVPDMRGALFGAPMSHCINVACSKVQPSNAGVRGLCYGVRMNVRRERYVPKARGVNNTIGIRNHKFRNAELVSETGVFDTAILGGRVGCVAAKGAEGGGEHVGHGNE